MPEVIFTPRVSVRRMCTPSRILFAASVRLISSMIFSHAGISTNDSARAERSSRSRCSCSLKIRPLYRRKPSHTASPPCTAESNGLIRALSRCTNSLLMFTIKSRFRSSNFCNIGSTADYADKGDSFVVAAFVSNAIRLPDAWHKRLYTLAQSALIKPLVAFTASFVNFAEGLRHLFIPWAMGLKRRRLCHFAIPIFCPDSIGLAQSRRPGQHRLAKFNAECFAKQLQHSLWIFQHVFGIENGR